MQLYACVGVNSKFPMEAAVQDTLGAVLRGHRALLPRQLWRTACMKCMLIAAASIHRMQQGTSTAAQKCASKSTTDDTSGQKFEAEKPAAAEPVAAEKSAPVTTTGLHWGMLDKATLATIQLRLRTYHHVLHESAPQVLSRSRCAYSLHGGINEDVVLLSSCDVQNTASRHDSFYLQAAKDTSCCISTCLGL